MFQKAVKPGTARDVPVLVRPTHNPKQGLPFRIRDIRREGFGRLAGRPMLFPCRTGAFFSLLMRAKSATRRLNMDGHDSRSTIRSCTPNIGAYVIQIPQSHCSARIVPCRHRDTA